MGLDAFRSKLFTLLFFASFYFTGAYAFTWFAEPVERTAPEGL